MVAILGILVGIMALTIKNIEYADNNPEFDVNLYDE